MFFSFLFPEVFFLMCYRLPILLLVLAALCCAGCASDPVVEKPVSTSIDVWDCRGNRPRRVTPDDNDPLLPHVFGLSLPQDGKGLNDISVREPEARKP